MVFVNVKMWKLHCLVCVLMAILPPLLAIVGAGRDLVLTPKQALQTNGKRIYYEEEQVQPQQQQQPQQMRSWERTLKHVTFVTLFTDAAKVAAAGNLSQLHDYHDFLQTPYIPAPEHEQQGQSRFGDIVTLASGRLEQLSSNGSYRFVEGSTDVQQISTPGSQPRALWRVQRIRHRDGLGQGVPQRYHYELKFSVSPLAASLGWPPQNYIQRESDYPQSFGRHTYEEKREQALAQRRQDRQPQATFVRGIFQPPPPPPNLLNIGEYLKEDIPKGTPKLDLFPGLFNLGLRPNFVPATTFRPSYPVKFGPATPAEHYPLANELPAVEPAAGLPPPAAPPVTHHFHHHFYMTPNGLAEGGASGHADLAYRPSTFLPELTSPAPPINPPFQRQHEPNRGLPLSAHREPNSAETLDLSEPDHPNEEQHPLLRPPLYGGYDQTTELHPNKLSPLLIYAGAVSETQGEEEGQKAFVQSEPLEETVYRYSEPDPLYVHQHPVDVLQLETPQKYAADVPRQQQPEQAQLESDSSSEEEQDRKAVQQEEQQHQQVEQRPAGSQKQPKLATTAAPPTEGTTKTTTTTAAMAPPTRPAPTSRTNFVSTSTSFTPLRALSRYRTTPRITAGRSTTTTSTTTTEQPAISKWKLRRKENSDNKAKSSHRHESKVAFLPSTAAPAKPTIPTAATTSSTNTTTTTTTTTTTVAPPSTQSNSTVGQEVVEVLTQKSVSKSVSIKVGENGEEIPFIVDDDENEVKHS